MRHILLTTCLLSLSGCATTSFAPPVVNLEQELHVRRTQTFFDATCSAKPDPTDRTVFKRNTEGALLLINNYLLTYRCQADRAAEGRQFFEVPGFLSSAGAATAAALGAGPHVAIGAGATSAVLGQGKSYYAPKDKAVVLNDGLDALLCIQNEAVGIDPYTLKTLSAAQSASGTGTQDQTTPTIAGTAPAATAKADNGPEVYVSSERQYFEMVRTALFSTERVVAQRLSAAGTPFDAAGVIAEIEALGKKVEEEEKEAKETTPEQQGNAAKNAVAAAASGVPASGQAAFTAAQAKLQGLPSEQVGRTVIKLRTLQPKLDKCIVRAKV